MRSQLYLGLVFAALILVLAAVPSRADNALDAPTISVVDVGPSYLTFRVTAGASGAPAGFILEWMTEADYESHGGWPASATDAALKHCQFTGVPTLNIADNPQGYVLGSNESVDALPGQLYDETGVAADYLSDLEPKATYVFRARALGANGGPDSPNTPDQIQATGPVPSCIGTPGFWKNHPELWHASSLLLGTVSYGTNDLMTILDTQANGNGIVSMGHLLIAAKLNIADGANPVPIAPDITQADSLIGAQVIPPLGSGFLDPTVTEATRQMLDKYDNGKLSNETCATTKARVSSWGLLRRSYLK